MPASRALKPEEPEQPDRRGGARTAPRRGWSRTGPGMAWIRAYGCPSGKLSSRNRVSPRAAAGSRRHPRPGWSVRRRAAAVAPSVPGARPRPRSIRPGAMASSVPNCSAITSGAWLGSMTPPEPRPDAVGVGGEVGEDHRGRGGGHPGHGVVFGDPVPVEAAGPGEPGELDAGAQRVTCGAAHADGHQVQYGEGDGGGAVCGAPDLVCLVSPPRCGPPVSELSSRVLSSER